MSAGLTAKPAAPAKNLMQRVTDSSQDWDSPLEKVLPGAAAVSSFGAGAINSGAHLLGNVLDMVGKTPSTGEMLGQQRTPAEMKMRQHVEDAANWLRSGGEPTGFWQNVGAIGEQTVEYLGTDGLLKLAGPAAGAVEAGEHLKQGQQAAQFLAAHPKIAGLMAVGLKASRDALLMGGQTYLHTEDPEQAAAAGAGAGALHVGAAAVGAGARALAEMGPKTLDIAGEKIPALASQVEEGGKPNASGAEGAPGIQQAQQAGAQRVIGQTAQDATEKVLNKINESRPVYAPVEGRAALPAPEGAKPFTFTLEGTPTTETTEGERMQLPRKKQIGTRVVEGQMIGPTREEWYTGQDESPQSAADNRPVGSNVREINPETGEAPPTDPNRPTATDASKLRKEPSYQYMSGSRPGSGQAAEDVAKGDGPLQTTDPKQAEGWLQQLEEIKASPAFDDLPARQQGQIEAQRKALEDQLGLYHASPYAQRFSPADVPGAVGQVRTFGDAAAQIQAAAKPVYQALDRASGGEFNKLNGVIKKAQAVIRNPASMEAADSAEARLSEANESVENLMTRHSGEISPGDYRAARVAWRASNRLSELHTNFERMMNGITPEESDKGFQRVMTGSSKRLESYLAKDTNRAQIEELIGKDGVTNLKQITELLGHVGTARTTASVIKNIAMEFGRHARVGGLPGAAGGLIAYHMGVPWFEGMMTGAAAGEGMRAVLRSAATSPRIGNAVNYAVRNGIDPKLYAPLIARMLAVPMQSQAQPE